VFRRLFGPKSDRPAPPKGQIEVVCPTCGAAQYEPRLVVSTFCKKCGVHLSITRGKVSASGVSRAGGKIDNSAWDNPATVPSAPSQKPSPQLPRSGQLKPISTPEPVAETETADFIKPISKQEEEEGGFGVFLKQQVSPASESSPEETPATSESPTMEPEQPRSVTEIQTIRRPQSNSPPPTPAPEPMSASTLQKMRDQGIYRNAYFKDADCFDCGHKFKVSRSSRSANCPQCGALISLEDVEINMATSQSIKTRGDVLIRKRGHLSTDLVICRDIRCQGIVEANIQAAGDAAFRTVGNIIGEVHCKRFFIEKGADVTFLNLIHAEEAEIQAKVTGTILCSGPLTIGKDGAVNGDVTARSVNIEPGGELNGAMNIVRTQMMQRPAL
jgi:cytoskeletal protein CcmA (bactofilin family)/ribosomal protein S27E